MYRLTVFIALLSAAGCRSYHETAGDNVDTTALFSEQHRPQVHFSPPSHWMNDPNGMVYHAGVYHLFYQHHPGGLRWGPMHWGHAISRDLVHWEHLPIALFPDSLGMIFSGSAVVDRNNTSGFGSRDNPPVVAVFTYHSPEGEKAGRTDFQRQGLAYSIDSGRTWAKYEGNPVLLNQGIRDFRDPKVFWHEASEKWVMILAVKDHVELWGSSDLKSWNKLSEFGSGYGAHGGVWECPDLLYVSTEGGQEGRWVMIVSLNPGAVNGGSGTQYFVGDFDGRTFTPDSPGESTRWLDYGPDNYAGVTWSNAPDNRSIFLGWMSNWAYAQEVPTTPWRSAMTVPRDLSLVKANGQWLVRSVPSPEILGLAGKETPPVNMTVKDSTTVAEDSNLSIAMVSGTFEAKDFAIELYNERWQKVVVGFDRAQNRFFIDRGSSRQADFSNTFFPTSLAPRVSTNPKIRLTMIADVSSVEVFFDDGLTVMTSLHFPDVPLSKMKIKSANGVIVEDLLVKELRPVWP